MQLVPAKMQLVHKKNLKQMVRVLIPSSDVQDLHDIVQKWKSLSHPTEESI
jgi:hypothetical protein